MEVLMFLDTCVELRDHFLLLASAKTIIELKVVECISTSTKGVPYIIPVFGLWKEWDYPYITIMLTIIK